MNYLDVLAFRATSCLALIFPLGALNFSGISSFSRFFVSFVQILTYYALICTSCSSKKNFYYMKVIQTG